MGGFLKSTFFSSLILFNFILSICFVVLIAHEGISNIKLPETEAIEQNPLPASVSEKTAQLMR
jgi:hypothetical protein